MNASNAALVTAISGSGSSARALQSHAEFGHGEIRRRVGRLGVAPGDAAWEVTVTVAMALWAPPVSWFITIMNNLL